MDNQIPDIVEALYPYFVMSPDPARWPDYLQDDPIKGHGLYAFYQGLRLGLQIAAAGLETV